ncbi:hypothetical protein JKF63_01611 [Porcisia hertigi]|uniref:Uncharacterized protein n=1 Tax=Porcisia hertigi TaxID=2761500 RepID=A0A836HLG9_9TRYP|nr:hypothetical protein JKF63_01611 [Porcisia hertigi]
MTLDAPAMPSLQRYARLSASVLTSNDKNEVQAALPPLLQYLSRQSCNVSEVEALEQWCCKQGNRELLQRCSGESMEVLKSRVMQRARVLSDAVVSRREMPPMEMRNIRVSAAAYTTGDACDNGRSRTATLVEWWNLSDDDPWSFTAAACCSHTVRSRKYGYRFICLKEALALVGPYLDLMRKAAATGDWDGVSCLFAEATDYVDRVSSREDPAAIFGSLELSRLHLTLTLASRGGVASVEKTLQLVRVDDDIQRVTALLDQLGIKDQDIVEMPLSSHPLMPFFSKVQAYWHLTLTYSAFFNTVTAYVDGSLGRFEGFAKALLGDEIGAHSCLWGAVRYSSIRFFPESTVRVRQLGPQLVGPSMQAGACSVMSTLFPYSSHHVCGTASDHYLDEFAPLVTAVIAPAASFSTLLVLSAIGSLPLSVALEQLRMCVECREVYETCSELTSLLDALWRGQLGAAWRYAKEAAARYLAHEPHIDATVAKSLLQCVMHSFCFHYLHARRTAFLADAAVDLGIDSPEEVAEAVTALISSNRMDARIDSVRGAICINQPDDKRSEDIKMEAAARAMLSFSALKMQLTCLSAERNLIAFANDG